MQFTLPLIQKLGGLLIWIQSSDLLNFITENTPEQQALYELENFLLRLTSDFMSNHGNTSQIFFYTVNKTIYEAVSGIVIPLEQYLILSQDTESMAQLRSIINNLKKATKQIDVILVDYYSVRLKFMEPGNPLFEHYPHMTDTTDFMR